MRADRGVRQARLFPNRHLERLIQDFLVLSFEFPLKSDTKAGDRIRAHEVSDLKKATDHDSVRNLLDDQTF